MKKRKKWVVLTAFICSSIISISCGGSSSGTAVEEEVGLEKNNPPNTIELINETGPNAEKFDYVSYVKSSLPMHYQSESSLFKNAAESDNTPENNLVTNEGARLGRVLFYDKNLSLNKTISCASCHQQKNGFGDKERFSTGFNGEITNRQSPGLTNARFYEPKKFFWDERAETLEEQVLEPIQNDIEMGMTLEELVERLQPQEHYHELFTEAFGDQVVTSERISLALAQFIRTLISYESKFDKAFNENGTPEFEEHFNEEEKLGLDLFLGKASTNGIGINCSICHGTPAIVSSRVANIGLPNNDDEGAGDGKFKAPSLRNVEVRKHFMHDGRFKKLRDVIDHYSENIQSGANVNRFLKNEDGEPLKPNYTNEEKDALIAFLKTLTDKKFLKASQFSDPFKHKGPKKNDKQPGPRPQQRRNR
jgi:cytochrome c peroxidase